MRKNALTLAAALLISSAVAAQDQIRTLRLASSIPWTVPPFQSSGQTQCDGDGNLYFDVSGTPSSRTVVMKVARDGSKYELYSLPAPPSGVRMGFLGFSVTRSGSVRILGLSRVGSEKDAHDWATHILSYNLDAVAPSDTRLQAPEYLQAKSFAAFESGAVLVSGAFNRKAPLELQGKPYTAVFDPSGKLAAEIRADSATAPALSQRLPEGGTVSGEDGFVYLLRSDSVWVISETGSVVRRLPFRKLTADPLATGIFVSKGLAVVVLNTHVDKGKPLKAQYLVLNASTGEMLGRYEPEPALGNNVVCFSRDDGLTFWQVVDGKDVLAMALLR